MFGGSVARNNQIPEKTTQFPNRLNTCLVTRSICPTTHLIWCAFAFNTVVITHDEEFVQILSQVSISLRMLLSDVLTRMDYMFSFLGVG